MVSSSTYPNKETFPLTEEFCFVLQKVVRICRDPYKKKVFERKVALAEPCNQILELNNTLKSCIDYKDPDLTILKVKPELIDFLYDYASRNIAILKMFIKDPYYTKYIRSETMTSISFVGNAGGLMGLCMGMSFVSIFEVFYHCGNNLYEAFKGCCDSKKEMVEVAE